MQKHIIILITQNKLTLYQPDIHYTIFKIGFVLSFTDHEIQMCNDESVDSSYMTILMTWCCCRHQEGDRGGGGHCGGKQVGWRPYPSRPPYTDGVHQRRQVPKTAISCLETPGIWLIQAHGITIKMLQNEMSTGLIHAHRINIIGL